MKVKMWKMGISNKSYTALDNDKDEPRRKGTTVEPPLSGVDSESLDDMMGESSVTINFTIPGVRAGAVLGVHKTIL